jgi:hypothetical protein
MGPWLADHVMPMMERLANAETLVTAAAGTRSSGTRMHFWRN